ncbi:MAG: hypothetical protein OHK0044_19380 [Burkholderiaceae bacterium]
MNRLLAMVLAAVAVTPAAYATDIGVSVEISQPGVYGRIDIGRFPQPAVVVPQPVIIAPPPPNVVVQPIYMWVPYGHRKNWAKHCHRYNACGYPVYFVRHDWYEQHVRRGDDRRGRDDDDRGRGKGKGKDKGKGRD